MRMLKIKNVLKKFKRLKKKIEMIQQNYHINKKNKCKLQILMDKMAFN
jgi:hypothetical protein